MHAGNTPTDSSPASAMLSGVLLLNASYAQVAEAFAGFAFNDSDERGGFPAGGKMRLVTPDNAPGYHRESTFSPTQCAYVGATAMALDRIAQGRPLVPSPADALPFASRIVNHFLAGQPEPGNFDSSLATSILDVYSAFIRQHPNLIPALGAMSTVAGITGTQQAFDASRLFFANSTDNDITTAREAIAEESAEYLVGSPHYAAPHNTTDPYEVWCSGAAFAKSLVSGAGYAALTLLGTPNIQSTSRGPYAVKPDLLQEELTLMVQTAVSSSRAAAVHAPRTIRARAKRYMSAAGVF